MFVCSFVCLFIFHLIRYVKRERKINGNQYKGAANSLKNIKETATPTTDENYKLNEPILKNILRIMD
jgi:hypothetical protein